MNELSLFSGAGGGLLATKHLLGWKTIGYVEVDQYCQAILAQRIEDGYLDPAPIFGDIKQFISEGYAESYKGMVDVITAGFPCQPFSVAGKQKGEQDERNLWPETRDTISIIRPRYIYLENVPNLLAHSYIWTILSEITEMGYDCKWGIISAADVGAIHKRARWWMVAHTNFSGFEKCWGKSISPIQFTQTRKWSYQSNVGRTTNDLAHRVDRLKAIGNGQVPRVVEVAWEVLSK